MDYAMLSRYSIQSTSDQDDYRLYATIAANAPTAVTPEQAAVWTYPMNHEGEVAKEELQEETVFNMINSMLLRIHQSGHLAKLDEERKSLVKEGIAVYKEIRKDIPQGFPFWPNGLSKFKDEWSSLGIQCGKVRYLAVWRRSGNQSIKSFPVQELKKHSVKASRVYPAFGREPFEWNSNTGELTVEFPRENMARLYRLEIEQKKGEEGKNHE